MSAPRQKSTVGPVRVDAATLAGSVVLLVFGYLGWLAGVQAPPEIISGTVAVVGSVAGIAYPNDGP